MKRAFILLAVFTLVAAYGYSRRLDLLRLLPIAALPVAGHDQYATGLMLTGVAASMEGRRWREAADASLVRAERTAAQHTRTVSFGGDPDQVAAWRVAVRRGQRLVLEVMAGAGSVFVDVFRQNGQTRVANSAPHGVRLEHLVDGDEDVIIRLQPPLGMVQTIDVKQTVVAGFRFPVPTVSPDAVHSAFGAARDGGGRRHEGVDIFAPRETPVVAVADGWIGSQTTNGLGGNVVWLWVPRARVSLYYAHLTRHAVGPGERVRAGDVVGYVGNTGNARTTRPHLHFGVYAVGEGALDPLPFVTDPPARPTPDQ